jgi:hypothetical protein
VHADHVGEQEADAVRAYFDPDTQRLHVLKDGCEAIFLPWPAMRAFRRSIAGDDWLAFDPEYFRIAGELPAEVDEESAAAVGQFAALVPRRLAALVAPYPDGHWSLLSWLARAGVFGDDLLVANACLAFMLASAPSFEPRPGRAHPAWASRPYGPQKGLLGQLGFPPTEQMRRVVQKVVHSTVSVPRLLSLRAALRADSKVLSRLSHVDRINANVLVAAAGAGLQVAPSLYAQLADASQDDPTAPLGNAISDTIRGWRLLHPRGALPTFTRVAHIQRLHEQVVEDLKHYTGRARAADFPAGPPGTEAIVPLLSTADLILEGRAQHNCVASYASLARRGQVALYRVLAPERATLSLSRQGGRWWISELKGPCNAKVSHHTRDAVRQWLGGGAGPDLTAGPRVEGGLPLL